MGGLVIVGKILKGRYFHLKFCDMLWIMAIGLSRQTAKYSQAGTAIHKKIEDTSNHPKTALDSGTSLIRLNQ
jgi:hypothetical protein